MVKSILKQLKEDERKVRRKLIIDAAKSLYRQNPFHSIGMRNIAAEAGISVASLYQYFPSQDDLYIGILKSELRSIKSRLWKDWYSLEEVTIKFVDYLMDHEDIFLMMSHFMVRGEKKPESVEKFNDIQAVFLGILDSALCNSTAGSSCNGFISRAFFTALFGNVITFRNYAQTTDSSRRDPLYYIARITTRAFEAASQSPDHRDELPGDNVFLKLEKT
jgi:AcrR family transcriptional regulator